MKQHVLFHFTKIQFLHKFSGKCLTLAVIWYLKYIHQKDLPQQSIFISFLFFFLFLNSHMMNLHDSSFTFTLFYWKFLSGLRKKGTSNSGLCHIWKKQKQIWGECFLENRITWHGMTQSISFLKAILKFEFVTYFEFKCIFIFLKDSRFLRKRNGS